MDYQALEEHIKDSVMEEQAKLGFRKEVIRLYYPVGMLNNLFGTACDAEEMQQALAQPFAPEDLEWRIQTTSKDKTRGMAVPYVTNRAIQTRLDEVCGPDNWYNDFKPWHANGKKESQLCGTLHR